MVFCLALLVPLMIVIVMMTIVTVFCHKIHNKKVTDSQAYDKFRPVDRLKASAFSLPTATAGIASDCTFRFISQQSVLLGNLCVLKNTFSLLQSCGGDHGVKSFH